MKLPRLNNQTFQLFNNRFTNNKYFVHRLEVNKEDNSLKESSDNWVDLSHDTDVNYIQTNRPNRDEANDIEVFKDSRYVPLNTLQYRDITKNKYNFNEFNDIDDAGITELLNDRKKREIIRDVKLNEKNKDGSIASDALKNYGDDIIASPQIGDFSIVRNTQIPIDLDGIRVEDSDKEPKIIEDGIPSVLADSKVILRFLYFKFYLTFLYYPIYCDIETIFVLTNIFC